MNECPHCYCKDTDVNGKAHVACCMCAVRRLAPNRLPIWTDYSKTANATNPGWLKDILVT